MNELLKQGFKWIARDEDGELWVYKNHPIKEEDYFMDALDFEMIIDKNLFPFITFENSPFEISALNISNNENTTINGFSPVGVIWVDEFNQIPKKIVYNTKLGRTTLIYNNNYVVRSEATQKDLKNSTLELGIYIALLKSLDIERLNHIINYTWTNFKTSKQKEIYLSGILHTKLQEHNISRNQLDKIIKSLKDNKDKVIVKVDGIDYHIELEYKGE